MATRNLNISRPCNASQCAAPCANPCPTSQGCSSCFYPYPQQLQAGVVCNNNCGCSTCDTVILMPLNPALLVAPAEYIIATAVEGTCGQLIVSFDDTILVAPTGPLSTSDFKSLCYDDYVRLILLVA